MTPIPEHPLILPALGGLLIGAAAGLYRLGTGRFVGLSGSLSGVLRRRPAPAHALFLAGLLLAPALAGLLGQPVALPLSAHPDWAKVAVAGLLVGFGTQLGSGGPRGHGACGPSTLPRYRLVSVAVLMLAAGSVVALGLAGL